MGKNQIIDNSVKKIISYQNMIEDEELKARIG